jgi:hypothetical protein
MIENRVLGKASGLDEMLMPAAPFNAQTQANDARSFNAEAGKGMRMARGKALVSGNTNFELFQAQSSEKEAVYDTMQRFEYARNWLQRGERKKEQLARGQGILSQVQYKLIQLLNKK